METTSLNSSINRDSKEIGQVVDPEKNRQKEREIFLKDYVQAFFKLENAKSSTFRRHMSQAPLFFFTLNIILRECYLSQELLQ